MGTPEEMLRHSDLPQTTPGTDTYAILRFLCAHRKSTVTPAAIADGTECPESKVVTALSRLEAIGAIERVTDGVQIHTDAAETLARRLRSLDAVTQLFDTAPDDCYATEDWESQIGSIDCVDENRK